MELWIRSQDREYLIKINRLRINKDKNWGIELFTDDGYTTIILGVYKTKERALEVLDEIQNILKPKPFIKAENNLTQENLKDLKEAWLNSKPIIFNEKASIQELSTYVYEMPKE